MIDIQVRTTYGTLNPSTSDGASGRAKDRYASTAEPSPKSTQGPGYTSFTVAPFTLLAAQEARETDDIRRDDRLHEDTRRQGRQADDADEDGRTQSPRGQSGADETPRPSALFADIVEADATVPDTRITESVVVEPFPTTASAPSSSQPKTPNELFARANMAYRTNGAVDGRTYFGGSSRADFTQALDQGFDIVI